MTDNTVLVDIMKYCDDNNINEFSAIFLYAKEHNADWFKVLCTNSKIRVIKEYFKAKRWQKAQSV